MITEKIPARQNKGYQKKEETNNETKLVEFFIHIPIGLKENNIQDYGDY